MLDALTLDDFAAHVGCEFDFGAQGSELRFKLTSATALGGGVAVTGVRKGFSLVFMGPAEPLWPQGSYRVVHPTRGDLELFLVPVNRDIGGAHYEAIFN